MSKYKIGDVVRVKSLDVCSEFIGWNTDGCMDHWCDKLMTIRETHGNAYQMEEDCEENGEYGWLWHEDMLEPVTYFTKDDFKTGMTVEVRCGSRFVVWGEYLIRYDGHDLIENLNDQLYNINSDEYDIMAIFDVNKELWDLNCIVTHPGKLIWKRKEEKEISSEEAFKVLKEHYGCDVKIKE